MPTKTQNPITDALATLHWLRLPERVDFKVAVMAFHVLHGLAPSYLDQLVRVADLPGRHRLRSSTSQLLHVPAYRLYRRPSLVSGCCIRYLELVTSSCPVLGYFVCFFANV